MQLHPIDVVATQPNSPVWDMLADRLLNTRCPIFFFFFHVFKHRFVATANGGWGKVKTHLSHLVLWLDNVHVKRAFTVLPRPIWSTGSKSLLYIEFAKTFVQKRLQKNNSLLTVFEVDLMSKLIFQFEVNTSQYLKCSEAVGCLAGAITFMLSSFNKVHKSASLPLCQKSCICLWC